MRYTGPVLAATALCGALALVPASATAQAQQSQTQKLPRYSLTVLGTLGGTYSAANAINDSGAVAGASTLRGDHKVHAFLWDHGVMRDLGTLGGADSFTPEDPAINNRGTVVGYSETGRPDPNKEGFCGLVAFGSPSGARTCLPFTWHHGTMTALPTLGGNNGSAAAINNRGQVAGLAETSHRDPTCPPPLVFALGAVLWQNGQARELPPFPGDTAAGANGINGKGQAVGASGTCGAFAAGAAQHALLWQHGTPIDLGNLGNPFGNVAFAINNRGQIVGQAGVPGKPYHRAFLWRHGTMTDLGTLPGRPVSLANAINNTGQVVGFSQDPNANRTVAWLWQNGVMTNLNALIPPGSHFLLQEALGINNRGQIVGYGKEPGQVFPHGYLLTPCHTSGTPRCGFSRTMARR